MMSRPQGFQQPRDAGVLCAPVVCAGVLFLLTAQAAANTGAGDNNDANGRRAQAIAENMMSPFCPATTLAFCSSSAALDWRLEIRRWVDEGLSDEEICQRMESRVGHALCGGRPQNWFGWVLPGVISICITAGLAVILRRFLRRPTPGPSALGGEPAVDPELEAQLDQELERLDRE